jgi:hypothetical protein
MTSWEDQMDDGSQLTSRDADFEEQGEHQVRQLLSSGGYTRSTRLPATEWLKRKIQERRVKEAAVDGERVAKAKSANARNRLVTVAAVVAASAATLGAVMWMVAWLIRLN